MTSSNPAIGILMGSDSDWPLLQKCITTLKDFGVTFEVRVLSAHRTPDAAAKYAAEAEKRGLKIIIAAAGGAAHLAGVIAAHTVLPVIGIPVANGALNGIDALLATIQMPAGIPVATVALGSAGPANAALLAVQILAITDESLRQKLHEFKTELSRKVETGNSRIQEALVNL